MLNQSVAEKKIAEEAMVKNYCLKFFYYVPKKLIYFGVQTGPKFVHIISIPSFYTFQYLKEIKLKKNELQLILSA